MEYHATYDMTREECETLQQELYLMIINQPCRKDWREYIRQAGWVEQHEKGGTFKRLTKPNSADRELREMWKFKRNEYYRSIEWAYTRNQCLMDADFVCSKCGERNATQAHHHGETASLAYGRLGRGHENILHPSLNGKNRKKLSEYNITPICQQCHMNEHGIEPRKEFRPVYFSGMFAQLDRWGE
jgi:hypothetical protein